MKKEQIKKSELANMEVVQPEVVQPEVVQPEEQSLILKISENDANAFLQIISIVLHGDDRLKVLQTHFVDIINRNNESDNKQ